MSTESKRLIGRTEGKLTFPEMRTLYRHAKRAFPRHELATPQTTRDLRRKWVIARLYLGLDHILAVPVLRGTPRFLSRRVSHEG